MTKPIGDELLDFKAIGLYTFRRVSCRVLSCSKSRLTAIVLERKLDAYQLNLHR